MPRRVVLSSDDESADDDVVVVEAPPRGRAPRPRAAASEAGTSRAHVPAAKRKAVIDLDAEDEEADESGSGEGVAEAMDADETEASDDDDDVCTACGQGGRLVCCDGPGCDGQYHTSCVGLFAVPKGAWFCSGCSETRKKRKAGKTGKAAAERTKSRKVIDDDELADTTKAALAAERARRAAVGGASCGASGGAASGAGTSSHEPVLLGEDDDGVGRVDDAASAEGRAVAMDSSDDEAGAPPTSRSGYVLNPSEDGHEQAGGVCVRGSLARQLKEHQKSALRFLFDNLVIRVDAMRQGTSGMGALLAHSSTPLASPPQPQLPTEGGRACLSRVPASRRAPATRHVPASRVSQWGSARRSRRSR
jgi:hypothetical protein